MKLKPTEILKQLGFTVPDDGVEVGEDLFYHQSMLALLGRTMSLNAIEDEAINLRHDGLICQAQAWGQTLPVATPADSISASNSRASMAITLNQCYGFRNTESN